MSDTWPFDTSAQSESALRAEITTLRARVTSLEAALRWSLGVLRRVADGNDFSVEESLQNAVELDKARAALREGR